MGECGKERWVTQGKVRRLLVAVNVTMREPRSQTNKRPQRGRAANEAPTKTQTHVMQQTLDES